MSVINTNYLALVSQNNLTKSQNSLGTAIERLSSGLRINSAKDDAAGQAIANRFTANINGLSQASRNANDGISVAQTTEGALNEINENLQRIRTLTVQASTGSNSASDLKSIQDEIGERLSEIDRVSKQTQFNGVNVLSNTTSLSVQVGAHDGQTINIDLKKIDSVELALNKLNVTGVEVDKVSATAPATVNGSVAVDLTAVEAAAPATDVGDTGPTGSFGKLQQATDGNYYIQYSGGTTNAVGDADTAGNGWYKVTADDAGALTLGNKVTTTPTGLEEVTTVKTSVAPSGAEAANIREYSGTNNGDPKFVISADGKYYAAKIDDAGAVTRGQELAVKSDKPLESIDDALQQVDDLRSHLGAIQNRFQSTIANLNNTVNNLSAARSRIEDADYAVEVSNMTRSQILQQAGTSVLAQANQVPQTVLSLLR